MLYFKSSGQSGIFVAYTEGPLLIIECDMEVNGGFFVVRTFRFPLNSIEGYTVHSFLGMKPSFIQIAAFHTDLTGYSRRLPIENLSRAEQKKLCAFLDGIITKTRRLASSV